MIVPHPTKRQCYKGIGQCSCLFQDYLNNSHLVYPPSFVGFGVGVVAKVSRKGSV